MQWLWIGLAVAGVIASVLAGYCWGYTDARRNL